MTKTHPKCMILLVIYQQKISETPTYRFLSTSEKNFTLIICDNSTDLLIKKHNQSMDYPAHIHYFHLGSNLGLSQAYIHGLKWITKHHETGWVMLLDQDTILNLPYFEEVLHLAETSKPAVYFPKVFTSSGLFSPQPLNPHLTSGFNKKQQLSDLLIPINSGTLWSLEILKLIQFDARLFLDMIDFDCFFQIIQLNQIETLRLMTHSINQNFSGESKNSKENDLVRFRIYFNDFSYFCEKWKVSPRYKSFILIKRSIKLAYQHLSFSFIKVLFK
jgi:GT2 family glycosyltransferase